MESSSQSHRRFSTQDRTLVIMAKAPRPGMVKTRLSQCLPTPAVTALYRCLLEDTVALAKSLNGVDLALVCPATDADELAHFLGDDVRIVAQTGDGLAAALTSVFRHFTEASRRRVIAFNSDSPHLAQSVLNTAFEMLNAHDVVIGPTHDGGYYLVGAKAAYPSLFEGDGMGTKSALDRLRTRTNTLQLSTGFTEPFYDIDVADDLTQLSRELRLAPQKAPRTAAWLREWENTIARLPHGKEER